MNVKNKEIYPNSFIKTRVVEIGGLNKSQLIKKLRVHAVFLNELGEKILMDEHFTTSHIKYSLETIELTVGELGLFKGDTLSGIFNKASELGLKLCPLEIAPYLRLNYLDQPKSKECPKFQAPRGAITIASDIIKEDSDFPKGFYLRNINGELWLRGYIASDDYIWDPKDCFVFIK